MSVKEDSKGHVTRFSDSSRYDFICVKCGSTDNPYGGTLHLTCEEKGKPLTEKQLRWIT
jgi:hypothetical protein